MWDITSFIHANQRDAHLHRTTVLSTITICLFARLLSFSLAKFNRALSALNNFIGIVTVTLLRGMEKIFLCGYLIDRLTE